MDEFDLALLDGIRNGFFDPLSIKTHATALNEKIKADSLGNAFLQAWEKYHDSFDSNQDEVMDRIYHSFLQGAKYISPLNMSSTVAFFKELGRPGQAADMIQRYVAARGEDPGVFDLRNYPFGGDVKDPDVIDAFNKKYSTLVKEKDAKATLLTIAKANGWSPEDVTFLSRLAPDEYYKVFKNSRGDDLRVLIKACLQFGTFGNAYPEMIEISNRAKEALKRIGLESPINARRVRGYGIEVTRDDKQAGAA
jgi:hypothetical protein